MRPLPSIANDRNQTQASRPDVSLVLTCSCPVQVKNVTGRLLVGLRWWNDGNSDSGEAWRFESLAEVRGHPETLCG